MLPSLTRIWATDREAATGHVARLSALSLHLALFASLQTLLFADIAVRAWLGPGFDDAGAVVRVTVSPAALFVVYLMLRSALDAVAVVSYNSRNNLVALAVFAGVAAISLGADLGRPVMCVAWSFAIGVAVQGVLTLRHRPPAVPAPARGLRAAGRAARRPGGGRGGRRASSPGGRSLRGVGLADRRAGRAGRGLRGRAHPRPGALDAADRRPALRGPLLTRDHPAPR